MSKEFKIVLIVFAVVAIISGIVYFTTGDPNKALKDDEQTAESEKASLESKLPKGIKITNEDLSLEDNVLYLDTTIKNTSKKDIELKEANIIIKDTKNKIVSDLTLSLNMKIAAGDEADLIAQDEVPYDDKTKFAKTVYIFK